MENKIKFLKATKKNYFTEAGNKIIVMDFC